MRRIIMPGYFVVGTIIALIALVLIRTAYMKKLGIKAMRFGEKDKRDFIIAPFLLLYFYLIAAYTFNLPHFGGVLFGSGITGWIGVVLCLLAISMFVWGMTSFGRSFRVGLDEDRPSGLVTTGAFAFSRNPLYLAFIAVLIAVFLIFPTVIFFIYLVAGIWLINRQIKLEERSLRKIYGYNYIGYCAKVRRFL